MMRTDNISSTLTHLTEFQQFLMSQINTMNNPDKKSVNASLRSSITKNFDTLRESLVQCSRIVTQTDPLPSTLLKKKVTSLQTELANTKEEFHSLIHKKCQETKRET